MTTCSDQPPACNTALRIIALSVFLGALLFPSIYGNIIKMVRSFDTGIAAQTDPAPLYGFFRPAVNKPACKDFTFGADFGLIYYNSKQFYKGPIYSSTQYDIFQRPLTYPPLLCFLYNKTLCRFAYPQAVLIHLAIQLILLLSASFFILNYYRLGFIFVPVAVCYFSILFLTPVGLAWVERGQSDIYSALAILFFTFAIYESKAYAFVLAAFFASLKPTIAPLFVQSFIIYLCIDGNFKKLFFFYLFTAVVLLTLLPFGHNSLSYLTLIYKERLYLVEGISLVGKMPTTVVLWIPIVSLLIYFVPLYLARKKDNFLKTFLPYASGLVATNILLTYTSWEYRIVSFLGFIPMIVAWSRLYAADNLYRKEFLSLFWLFLFIAFHGFWIFRAVVPKQEYFIASYLAYYLAVAVITISRIRRI